MKISNNIVQDVLLFKYLKSGTRQIIKKRSNKLSSADIVVVLGKNTIDSNGKNSCTKALKSYSDYNKKGLFEKLKKFLFIF